VIHCLFNFSSRLDSSRVLSKNINYSMKSDSGMPRKFRALFRALSDLISGRISIHEQSILSCLTVENFPCEKAFYFHTHSEEMCFVSRHRLLVRMTYIPTIYIHEKVLHFSYNTLLLNGSILSFIISIYWNQFFFNGRNIKRRCVILFA